MPIVKETMSKSVSVFITGSNEAALLVAAESGTPIEYSTDIYRREEHDSVSAAVDDVVAKGLTPSPEFISGLPDEDDPEGRHVRQKLGVLKIFEEDFEDLELGAIAGESFTMISPKGDGAIQAVGVSDTFASDVNSLGYSKFLSVRPFVSDKNWVNVSFHEVPVAGLEKVTFEIDFGSAGELEDDDTLEIVIFSDTGEELFRRDFSGNVPRTQLSEEIAVRCESLHLDIHVSLGEGEYEAIAINRVAFR